MNAELVERLREICGADAVILEEQKLNDARYDIHEIGCAPTIILRPTVADTLPNAIAEISRHRYAIAPRGGD